MSLRQYSGSFLWPIIFVVGFSFLIVFMILWLVFAAVAADNNPPCLTKEQARARYPGAWLYWHSANRCWDNRKGGGVTYTVSRAATWGKQNSLKLAKPNPDSNGNTIHHSGRPIITELSRAAAGATVSPPLPAIAYPTLMTGGGTTNDMLQPDRMNTWPLIMDFDVEPPQFIPWQKRIAAAF